MEDVTRTRPDVAHTQPLDTVGLGVQPRETRSFRLVRTIVFALAILVGIATVVVITRDDARSVPNSAGVSSPSGHMPGEHSEDPNVSMSWEAVEGAVGYWWGMVEDPGRLPRPVIRPSGDDRRVFFRFSGRGYFVLRTAFRADGRLHWSRELLYGPIVVRYSAGAGASPSASPGPETSPSGGGSSAAGTGSRESSAGGSGRPQPTPVDPRYAGEPGSCGTGGGTCGGAGQPGQPAQQPGGGQRPSNDEGTPGRDGPNGQPGPD